MTDTHTVEMSLRAPDWPRWEMCWADHPIHVGRSALNFHCLQPAAAVPDLGLCPGHLTEIFGITADGRGQGLGRVP